MPKNKYRIILVIVFSITAGYIISSKMNKAASNRVIIPKEHPSPTIKSTPDEKNKKTTAHPKNKEINRSITVNKNKTGNYLVVIPKCLNLSIEEGSSLKGISHKQKWLNKGKEFLIRQNLIFKDKGSELRISITPSEANKNWTLQSFTIDSEGLPVPKNKIQGLQYYQLADKIKEESKNLTLASDEQNILVNTPNISGSILFINDEPSEIKLFNKTDQKILECQGTNCVCNQALSS